MSSNTGIIPNPGPKEIRIPAPTGHIAGKIWNEGGTPLIGLHGWMDNAGTWDGIAPLLPKNLSLISIDFPGHGWSPLKQTGGANFLDLVLIIERVVRHFAIEEVNLLGHSMGGGAAFYYAATFPQKVKKLIMVDLIKPTTLEAENQPTRTAGSIEGLLLAESKLGNDPPSYDYATILDKLMTGYNGSLTEDSAKTLLERGSVKHDNGKYSFTYDPRVKVRNILSLTFEQQKVFARQLDCEFLLIKASKGPIYEDQALYDEIIGIYKERAKVFKYVVLEGTHHVHMNNPDIVAPVINDFMSS